MQGAAWLTQSFDCRDLAFLRHQSEGHAGQSPLTIDVYRAGAALSVRTTLLGASQSSVVANRIQQRRTWIQVENMRLLVDTQSHALSLSASLHHRVLYRCIHNLGTRRRLSL